MKNIKYVPYIVGMTRGGLLHCDEWEYLQQVILHDIPYDAKLIKITASAESTKRFFECYLNGGNIIPIPRWTKYSIAKTKGHQILNHLLAKIMIDTIYLFLGKETSQMIRETLGARRVPPEWFFDYYSRPAPGDK